MELASAQIIKRGSSYEVQHGDDTQIVVEFYNEAVRHEAESVKAGREICVDVPFIHMIFPGDRTKERRTKATEEHKQRFPRQWEAFQRQESQAPTGTPIESWAMLSKATAKNLKAMGILTVELLAGCNDQAVSTFMGGQELRKKAQAWLASADDGAEVSRLVEENKNLRTDIEMLKKQIADIAKGKKAREE